ncbi:hypothetical protein OQA88_1044 [Cercophora sp. LCS_1]
MPIPLKSFAPLPGSLNPKKNNGTQRPPTKERRHTVTERERQMVRRHATANPLLTQRELSAWALKEFGRPINQSTIPDILKLKKTFVRGEVDLTRIYHTE